MKMPVNKYKAYKPIDMPDRKWPSKMISHAPRWCSVDLRDGNQALVIPMSVDEKREMFNLLVEIGFKEIEVGFPSASQTEHDFLRSLIEGNSIPEDVTIQVLTQARDHLIKKTFEALHGARRAIVHLYNSTSELQRRVVFRMGKNETIELAVRGASLVREEAEKISGTEIIYEYSPESFTGTELDFAVEISEAVMDIWEPASERKMIINLPATVEMATPNIYADQIEWFCRQIKNRDNVIISSHAHNDRGTAVAATEFAIMAGAERVEGTLFGNGERTGNVDIITLALNMFSQGIDPELDLNDINRVIGIYEKCSRIPVHMRHPYVGELVYTAFSGSHQDAINKGMKAYYGDKPPCWEVPYLPIDPSDVGRTYESIIRINSQSGKGGIAYVMEQEYGFSIPKEMQPEFGMIIQKISDETGSEIFPETIREAFYNEYIRPDSPFKFKSFREEEESTDENGNSDKSGTEIKGVINVDGIKKEISGKGNGPIDAFSNAVKNEMKINFRIISYYEHALEQGSDSKAVAYIRIDVDGNKFWGAGIDTNIDVASFKAILSALNRAQRRIEPT